MKYIAFDPGLAVVVVVMVGVVVVVGVVGGWVVVVVCVCVCGVGWGVFEIRKYDYYTTYRPWSFRPSDAYMGQ